jgi:hypothetical protein
MRSRRRELLRRCRSNSGQLKRVLAKYLLSSYCGEKFVAAMKSELKVHVASYKASRRRLPRIRVGLLLIQFCLVALLATALSSTFRNNDQAAYIGGAIQLAHGDVRGWAAPFYNYDKQYATYLMVAGLVHLFPNENPVWLGNLLTFALFALSALSICIYSRGNAIVPLAAFVPVILSPALALYVPFLGTSCLSYSILVCAFMVALLLPGHRGEWAAALLVALAVASRADAILAMPAFVLSIHSRQRIGNLIRDPVVLTLGLASVLPIVLGKLIYTGVSVAFAGFLGVKTQLTALGALVVFSFGLGESLILLALVICYALVALEKKRWRTYYALTTLSILIPIGFYGPQLFTPTFFLLQLAVTLFFLLNRRTARMWRHLREHRHSSSMAILTLCVFLSAIPWIVGVDLPQLSRPGLTLLKPTMFPTSHGAVPMGAYGMFIWRLKQNRFVVDHNQTIWNSAETVDYRTCNGRDVFLAASPMVNYLELAVRFQSKTPVVIRDWKESPCGLVYVDSRSVTRTQVVSYYPGLRDLLSMGASVASQDNNGQPILLVETGKSQSIEAAVLLELRDFFGGQQFEIAFTSGDTYNANFISPYQYVIFADTLSCQAEPRSKLLLVNSTEHLKLRWDGALSNHPMSATVSCPGATIVGSAKSVLPNYMF